ncbi:MAG: alpha/beta fold hydrolase [Pseudomonadota bacterium]
MSPRTFVLISGAWHGAWCWRKIVPLLEAQGHQVLAPELPATGADHTDPASITLETWARFVVGQIRVDAPAILVGHSRGGIVISRAAELAPGRVRRLVYVSGYLLPAGGTIAEAARGDHGSLVPPNMIPAAGGLTCNLRESAIREALFGQCTDEDVEYARARLSPEPLKPLVTPLKITEQGFGRIPRAYLECTQDRTITLAAQRRMQSALPCAPVLTLDSDHSPFFSHPEPLAQWLGDL